MNTTPIQYMNSPSKTGERVSINPLTLSSLNNPESSSLQQELRNLDPIKQQSLQTKLVLFFAEMERVTLINGELYKENQFLKDQAARTAPKATLNEQMNKYNNEQSMPIIADLKSKLNVLLEENNKLVEATREYSTTIEDIRHALEIFGKENESLKRALADKQLDTQILHENLIALDNQHQELQRNNMDLYNSYNELQIRSQNVTEVHDLQNKIAILVTENARLVNNFHEKSREYEISIQELTKKAGVPADKIYEISNKNAVLIAEIDKLNNILNAQNVEIGSLRIKNLSQDSGNNSKNDLHSKIILLGTEYEKLTKENQRLNGEIQKISNEHTNISKENEQLKATISVQIQNLTDQIEGFDINNEELKKRNHELNTKLGASNATVPRDSDNLIEENNKMKSKMADISKEMESWKGQYLTLEEQVSIGQSEYEAKISGLVAELDKMGRLTNEKLTDTEVIKDDHEVENKVAILILENEKLNDIIIKKEKESDILREKLNETEHKIIEYDNKLEQVVEILTAKNKELETAKNEIDALRFKNQSLDGAMDHASKLEDQSKNMIFENERLNNSLDDRLQEVEVLNIKIRDYEVLVKKLVKENSDLKATLNHLSSKIQDLDMDKTDNLRLSLLHEDKAKEIDTLVNENQKLKQLMQTKLNEINQISQVKNEIYNENEKLNRILNQLGAENDDLKERLENFIVENQDMASKLTHIRESIAKAKDTEKHALALKTDYDRLTGMIAEKVKENEILKVRSQDNEDKLRRYDGLNRALNAKNEENDSLKNRLSERALTERALTERSLTERASTERSKTSQIFERSKQNEQIELLTSRINELDREKQEVVNENAKLVNYLNEVNAQYENLKRNSSNDKKIELEKKCLNLQVDNDKLMKTIHEIDNDMQMLRNRFSNKELDSNQLSELKTKFIYCEKENNRLQQILNEKLIEIDALKKKYYVLENDTALQLQDKEDELEHWKSEVSQLENNQYTNVDLRQNLNLLIEENDRLNGLLGDIDSKGKTRGMNDINEVNRFHKIIIEKEEEISKKNKRLEMLEHENRLLKRK